MNKGLHRFALLVACATFFLIIAGALVTSHDAGLATSDWPRSNGQWFPKMVGNLFWEHGHRMVATAVGLLTIALAVSAAHATLAQLFFLITVSLAVFTSPGWLDTQKLTIEHDHGAPIRPMCV